MGCKSQFKNKDFSDKLLQINYQDIKVNHLSGDLHGWCYDINRDKSYKTNKNETPANKSTTKEINTRDFLLRNSLQPSKPYIFHHYRDLRRYMEQYRRENVVESGKPFLSLSRIKAFQKTQKEQESRMIAFKNQYASQLMRENATLGSQQPAQQKDVMYTHWFRVGMHQPMLGPSPLVTSSMLGNYDESTITSNNFKKQLNGGGTRVAIKQIRTTSARSMREKREEKLQHNLSPGHMTDRLGSNNERLSLSKIDGPAKELLTNGIRPISARRKLTTGMIRQSQSISAKLYPKASSQLKDLNSSQNRQDEHEDNPPPKKRSQGVVVRDGHSADFSSVLIYKLNELLENRKNSISSISSVEEEEEDEEPLQDGMNS